MRMCEIADGKLTGSIRTVQFQVSHVRLSRVLFPIGKIVCIFLSRETRVFPQKLPNMQNIQRNKSISTKIAQYAKY